MEFKVQRGERSLCTLAFPVFRPYGQEVNILTYCNENDLVTLTEMSGDEDVGTSDELADSTNEINDIETEDSGRAEYEALIRGKYREHFAADTQRLINRRFKKYKALEEKVKELEEAVSRSADIEKRIAEERERTVKETEERMNRQFRSMRGRADENALTGHSARSELDVKRLTKSERALLAKRAQKGEKIRL